MFRTQGERVAVVWNHVHKDLVEIWGVSGCSAFDVKVDYKA
jgi:hypothetical protein